MLDKIIGMPGNIKVHLSDRGEYVIDIDTTYGGQTSLSTLGTVTIGNWCASILKPAFGGTGMDNGEFTISIGGPLNTTGAITFECEKGSIVSLPANGRLVNRSETLDPALNLTDVHNINNAYDNLAPVAAKGDIVVFDGETNWPLTVGYEGQWLAANPHTQLGLEWKPLPSAYSYVLVNDITMNQRDKLNFCGESFRIRDDDYLVDSTVIRLAPNLESLAALAGVGFLARHPSTDGATQIIRTHFLLPGNGIIINNPDGHEDPIISISPIYKGQPSIEEVGHVKHGYWGGNIVDPEFGGTGHANQYGIVLGGEFWTECNFSVVTYPGPGQNSLQFIVGGLTQLSLPTNGRVATEEESLQCRHNLGDIGNKLQAFSNISPTKNRGDLIVRGYGDYDTVVEIGAPGQVLTVVEDEPGYMQWTNPLTIEDVDMRIEEYIDSVFDELHEASLPQPNTLAGMPLETVIEAILMQFDHMKTIGSLQPIKELKPVLDQWAKSKYKKAVTLQ